MRQPDVCRLQESHVTHYLRYPQIFERLASELSEHPHPRVLVFGASLGHECMTLLGRLPRAQVVACEIDDAIRTMAQAIHAHGRVVYCHPDELEGMGTYDLLVCHSVFCHHPANDQAETNTLWTFREFEEIVDSLHRKLRVGGWWSIINAEFRFSEAAVARDYKSSTVRTGQQVQVFDRHGRALGRDQDPVLWQRLR